MALSFTIAEDATATLPASSSADPPRGPDLSPSPSASRAADSPNWTTVGRHGRHSRPKPIPSHSRACAPLIPPPPDADASLESLRRDFRREQRRWHATGKNVADGYRQIFSHEVPGPTTLLLDSVVCVALGSLSGTVAPPPTCDGKAIIGGQAREVSMKQLVALEQWIALLRERCHALPAPGEISSAEDDEMGATDTKKAKSRKKNQARMKDEDEDQAETKEEEEKTAEIPDPFTTPSLTPLRGVKMIQDPCFNALDARFLHSLGYIVLPSDMAACSFASTKTRTLRSDHAGSHITTSTFFYAPHAPHTLVRADILPGPGPGVYVGNRVEGISDAFADDDDNNDGKNANQRGEDGAAWTVHTPRKRRPGKAKGTGTGMARMVQKATAAAAAAVSGSGSEDVDDERGHAMTKDQMAQMARWKARRRTIAPSRVHKDGIEVAFMDTWVYVLETAAEEKEDEKEDDEQRPHIEETKEGG